MLKVQTSCKSENNTAVVHKARRQGFTWRTLQMELDILQSENLRCRRRLQRTKRCHKLMLRRKVIRLTSVLRLRIQPMRRHLVLSRSQVDCKDLLVSETRRILVPRTPVEADRNVQAPVNKEVKVKLVRNSRKRCRKILMNHRWCNRSIAQDLTYSIPQQINLTNSITAIRRSLRTKYSISYKAWLKTTKSISIKTRTLKRWLRHCVTSWSRWQIKMEICLPLTTVRRTFNS